MSRDGGSDPNSAMSSLWILRNPLRGWTLGGLTAREARLVISTLSSAERILLHVMREGKPEWFRLSSAFSAPLLLDLKEFPVPTNLPEVPEDSEPESTRVQLVGKAKEFRDRKFDRLFMNVPVEVLASGHTFQTTTEDLSEGGLRVRDLLPDWIAGYFIVVMKAPTDEFELYCSMVEDQKKDRFRIEVVSQENDPQYLKYCSWVKEQREKKASP